MSWLRSLSSAIFGTSSDNDSSDLLQIEGALFLDRPDSIRGAHECLFPDATLTLRRTNTPFTFHLIVTRTIDEDDNLDDDDDDSDNDVDSILGHEKIFIVSPNMRFHTGILPDNLVTFRWNEVDGPSDDIYEFAIAGGPKSPTFIMFRTTMLQCIYQRLYMRSHENASNEELDALIWVPPTSTKYSVNTNEDKFTPLSSVPLTPTKSSINPSTSSTRTPTATQNTPTLGTPKASNSVDNKTNKNIKSPSSPTPARPQLSSSANLLSLLPTPNSHPTNLDLSLELDAELFLYLIDPGQFQLVDSNCTVQLWSDPHDPSVNWILVESVSGPLISHRITSQMNHMFWPDQCAMIWNLFYRNTSNSKEMCLSVSVNLSNDAEFKEFRRMFTQLHVQTSLEASMASMKLNDSDLDYLEKQVTDTTHHDYNDSNDDDDDNSDTRRSDESDEDDDDVSEDDKTGEQFDPSQSNDNNDSGSDDEVQQESDDSNVENSLLTTSKTRAFVVRGGSIGIFGYTNRGKVRFETMMNKLKYNRTELKPTQVLLHQNDSRMIIVDETKDATKAYELDLQGERIVNEYNVPENRKLVNLSTSCKSTEHASGSDATFLGISDRSVFRVDTRMGKGNAAGVINNNDNDNQNYSYSSNVGLQSIASNAAGQVAVGSMKGELRLYNHVGKRATTALQSAGDPITHLDVSVDGNYVLATTNTALLLFNVSQTNNKGIITTGFTSRMSSTNRPSAIRLGLRPQHVAKMTGHPVQFTKAYFNVSSSLGETSLITSTGPYVITWSLNDVLNGKTNKYTIKEYGDVVVADQFRFGDDQNIVLALPNDVQSVSRRRLHRFG